MLSGETKICILYYSFLMSLTHKAAWHTFNISEDMVRFANIEGTFHSIAQIFVEIL